MTSFSAIADRFLEQKRGKHFPDPELCQVCRCVDYVIRLHLTCSGCQGGVCAKCEGCLRAGHTRIAIKDYLIVRRTVLLRKLRKLEDKIWHLSNVAIR
jgi:hypothetical protein